jgi:dTMP kinase
MRRPCLRCGADLPPPDPDWGGRPRQYCGAACRKAGQRLRATLGGDWWQQQPWYPAWAAASERERQEQEDRADAERRERDRQAETIRQQAEEKRRKADEDRKLLESMPPHVRAGAEAARRAEGERARRQFSLLALRMDLELLSKQHATILAETGQRVQLTGQASRTEKLLWAAALAPDDAEAQALFAKARELAAKDQAQRPDAAIGTADSFGALFPARPARPVTASGPAGLGCSAGARGRGAARRSAGVPPRSVPGPRHPGGCPGRVRGACPGRDARCAGCQRPGWCWPAGDRCPVGLPQRFWFPGAVLNSWRA